FLKMFQAGHSERTFELLRDYDLFSLLFPETDDALNDDESFLAFVRAALANTDQRVRSEKSVTPMFLLGVFLWEPVRRYADQLRSSKKMSVVQSLTLAAYEISGLQQSRVSIPRRFTSAMREMLAMQPRFEVNRGKRALNFLEHRRFRAAYDFMMLRARGGDFDEGLAEFWTSVQTQNTEERRKSFQMQQGQRSNKGRRLGRRRRRDGQKE
ncbi:MAG: polynucleotide adenylyltransferase PcnB, partial [Pseudomonadota bacterium]|nr:polynucleotide adenylyltransferase PcnB [Pseudomonadota bacterium]